LNGIGFKNQFETSLSSRLQNHDFKTGFKNLDGLNLVILNRFRIHNGLKCVPHASFENLDGLKPVTV
jgi:hypothetical protein